MHPSAGLVGRGVGQTVLGKRSQAQKAGIAVTARLASGCRVIAGPRQRVVDAQGEPTANRLALGDLDERRMDTESIALDAALRSEIGHGLERTNVLGTAIWIAAVVERIDPDEDVVGLQHLGVRERRRRGRSCCEPGRT